MAIEIEMRERYYHSLSVSREANLPNAFTVATHLRYASIIGHIPRRSATCTMRPTFSADRELAIARAAGWLAG